MKRYLEQLREFEYGKERIHDRVVCVRVHARDEGSSGSIKTPFVSFVLLPQLSPFDG